MQKKIHSKTELQGEILKNQRPKYFMKRAVQEQVGLNYENKQVYGINSIKWLSAKVKTSKSEYQITNGVIKIDALYNYIKSKKQNMLDNISKEKTKTNIIDQILHLIKVKRGYKKIADEAPKAKFYFSHANPSYQNVSYQGKHYYFFTTKAMFLQPEELILIRGYIPNLQCRSKYFFIT